MAEGERYFELRGSTERCRNAGHHRIGDAGLAQCFDFLATASEHEWVAALEAHRTSACSRRFDHQFVDRCLTYARLADAAAHGNAHRIAARAIEHFGRNQFIVENNISVLQRAKRLDGQQIRIARTGANQRHASLRLARFLRACKAAGVTNIFQCGFSFVAATGKDQRSDGAIDHAFPEAAAQ